MNLIERLNELFTIDSSAGTLTRKITCGRRRPAGEIISANGIKSGYKLVNVDNKMISLHRIIWMMSNGEIPAGVQIDHINGNSKDNRLSNLRACTPTQNMMNKRAYSNNRSGYKGVYYDNSKNYEKKWRAQITVEKKQIPLGRFRTPELAYEAYQKAAIKHFGEFARI